MEAVYRDYKEKNVNFYFVYKALAHPQDSGFVRPATLKERLMHAEKAKKSLGTSIPWIVDSMDNELKHAMGNRNNSEFIVGPDGKIVRMRDWSNPELVRSDLVKLVGPVKNPTDPRSLNIKTDFAPTKVARGVVDRIQRDGQMSAVKVKTIAGTQPSYVKLRAEADRDLMNNDKGQLYLRFSVDPIHQVHWNNQAGPVKVEVNGKSYTGPTVKKADADGDPREFVVDVNSSEPIEIALKYVGCDDAETWCRQLTQEFVVTAEIDGDAGRAQAGGGRGGGGRGAGGRGGGRGGRGAGGRGGGGRGGRGGPGGGGRGRGPGGRPAG